MRQMQRVVFVDRAIEHTRFRRIGNSGTIESPPGTLLLQVWPSPQYYRSLGIHDQMPETNHILLRTCSREIYLRVPAATLTGIHCSWPSP